ncbi:MAG: transporter [Herbaspirillum sp.]|nr:transporter [Herbaspirillum sp.]
MPSNTASPSGSAVRPFRELLLAMLGICFVVMLVALDQTVVGTALPTVVAELKGFDLYAWVATSYLLTSVITVPIFGRLGDYFGRKPFVIASVIIFSAASVLCGLSDSMLFLVLARGLQGIGGGMLVGTAFACIPDLFPEAKVRLRWQVLMSSSYGIATAFGPSLGGFLTQHWGWRWVFYVNLPFGILSLYFIWRFFPHIRHLASGTKIRLDWPGALLITLALGSLQFLVEALPKHGFSLMVMALLAVCVASFYGLWKWEQHASQPLLPLEMMRDPSLSPLFALALLTGFAMFGMLVYAPLLFQGGFGMSPQHAGLLITPLVTCITVASILNGRLITRIPRPNAMLYIGFICIALSSLGMALMQRTSPLGFMLTVMLIGGLGFGLVLPNLTIFAQQTAAREYMGIATALLQSLRMVGGMLGTAIIGMMVNHMYASGVRQTLEESHGEQWLDAFKNPEILLNQSAQQTLMTQTAQSGHNGLAMLDAARDALVGSIHLGVALAIIAALIAVWMTRRVPLVSFGHAVGAPPPLAE